MIDLITNSSTEIFVHSENSVEPAKELLTELLKINGSDKTCDEVFEISLERDKGDINTFVTYHFEDYIYENKIEDVTKFIKDVNAGNIQKPEWWHEIEEEHHHVQTYLLVKSKDKKYDNFISLLKEFLYSPSWYEHSSEDYS